MQTSSSRLTEIPMIILAGGRSSRMGFPKGLATNSDQVALVNLHIFSGQAAGMCPLVVTGCWHDQYVAVAQARCVRNPDPDRGPFSSIQVGLAGASQSLKLGAFVVGVDALPLPAHFWQIFDVSTDKDAIQPLRDGKPVHPIYLGPGFVHHLLQVDPGSESGRLDIHLRELPIDRRALVPVPKSWPVSNFNTPADLQNLLFIPQFDPVLVSTDNLDVESP